jgi:glutaredoxin 3
MKTIVYSKTNCPACDTLKAKLRAEGVDYVEIMLGKDMSIEAFKEKFPTVRSVPHQVLVKDETW